MDAETGFPIKRITVLKIPIDIVPEDKIDEAVTRLFRDGGNHSSPNSGIPEAAAAGALGVQLGGTNRYFGAPVEKPTIGDPHRPLDRQAWLGAVRLMYGAELLLLLVWTVVAAVWRI